MKRLIVFGLVAVLAINFIGGCSSWKKRDKGAVIGGAAGAAAGAAIGSKAGNTALGAILGAVIGGAAGAYIGNQMDKRAEEIRRDLDGAKVERKGEGILITFDSGILFDVDSFNLKQQARDNVSQLATILNKYNDVDVMVDGHTDATGSEDHNLNLSRRRAGSVAEALSAQGVSSGRIKEVGNGESFPVADNATAEGRQLNRRVEVAIYANDKLKKAAEAKVEDQG